jgi:hypothetical protein
MPMMDCSVRLDMADISNNNSKFKLTTNVSFIGSFVIIILFMITLLFSYYIQFFVDVDQMSEKARRGTYILFGREYSSGLTVLFLILNFLIAKFLIYIFPRVLQILKYRNGFIFHDMKNIYFGNEKISLSDVYKCANDFSAEFKHPHHKFWIYNLSGKSYWCHYVFEEEPKQLAAQIEKLAHEARLAA